MTTPQEAHPDIFGLAETETPVDVINSLQEPPKPAPAVDQTALALRSSLEKVTGALTEFDKVSAGLDDLRRKYKDVVFPVATRAGMAEALAARTAIRGPRYSVERLRKDAKAPVLALGRDIDARAAFISTELLKLEEPVQEQIQAQEMREAAERTAKREAEEARIAAHHRRIEEIRLNAMLSVGKPVSFLDSVINAMESLVFGPECQEFEDATRTAQAETLGKLRAMRDAQAKRDAEAAELARLRAEEEVRRAEEASALAESRRVEGERLKAEAAALAEARKAQEAEFARRRAEQEEIEAAAAKERARLLQEANQAAAAARAMREVEEAQAKRAAEARREQEEAESAERRRIEIAAIAEQQRQDVERIQAETTLRNGAIGMLNALLCVRDWDLEAAALPVRVAEQVQRAIVEASPAHERIETALTASAPRAKRPKSQAKRLVTQVGTEDDGHPE